ncbi:SIR2 family protein [Secundilactobacillus paracollinoides]|uniref:SIR2 family protein n=1 Tax=Secundilactobacillus paracollinoides TaxID=240427 RepID=UPI0006D06DCF|nr:SIR2 family protein [Secundilactobacillus paracollinoides]
MNKNENDSVFATNLNSESFFKYPGMLFEKKTGNEKDAFLKNGRQITNEHGDEADINTFKDMILNVVKLYLARNYTQIVFIAGAGASITGYQDDRSVGKSMKDLKASIKDRLENQKFLSLDTMASLCKYEYTNPDENQFDLEDFISKAESAQPFIGRSKNKYLKTLDQIYKVIEEETSYSYDERLLFHNRVINMLANKVVAPNKLTVVTTNYDTLFEDAAEKLGYSVIDGFSHDLNPFFDADNFEWNLVRDIPNLTTDELVYKKQVINLIKLHGSLTWTKPINGRIYRRNKQDKINQPNLIFPSSNKYMQSYTEPFFDLFSKFQELINRPNTLLITNGFSFGDNHISQMVHHAVSHNEGLSVLVTDFNISNQISNGWKELENLMNAGYSVAFLKATINELPFYLGGDLNEH